MQPIDDFLDTWTHAERDGDVATLERILTDDFVGVGAVADTGGRVMVALDHTIVPATDKRASAEFLAGILGLEVAPAWGPFVPLRLGNGITLDFHDAAGFEEHHYAFLVSEAEFDVMFERLQASGTAWYADPGRRQPGVINHRDGGRGVYFDDPDRHFMELITRPYGTTPG